MKHLVRSSLRLVLLVLLVNTVHPHNLWVVYKTIPLLIYQNPFANFFGNGYQVREEVIRSKKIKINVNELPASPEFFDGAVGNMEVKSEVDHNTINANEAITYKLFRDGAEA